MSGISVVRPAGEGASFAELRRAEEKRAGALALVVLVLCALVVLVEPMAPGRLALRVGAVGAAAALAAVAAWVYGRGRAGRRFQGAPARLFAAALFVASMALTARFGVLSPALLLATLAIAFFADGEDVVLAAALTGAVVVGELAIAALTMMAKGAVPLLLFVTVAQTAIFALAASSRRAALAALAAADARLREVRSEQVREREEIHAVDRLLASRVEDGESYRGASAGKYRIGKRIGRGAMGEVYEARDAETGRAVAIKVLHPALHDEALFLERFRREAEAASALHAPNVVSVHEVGTLDDGAPFLAMELLRGHDLGWHLRQRGRLSLDEVRDVVTQVARGLEVARAAGVVHRDLKPQNLFLAQQLNAAPLWKILDFGVSRLAGSNGTLTRDVIVGTPGYMSPEQAAGTSLASVSHRSDVFSLAAVVYRALTGETAFQGEDPAQTLYQVVYQNPPRPSERASALPADVDLVLAIGLAKDPEDRFATALELAAALDAAAAHALDPALRLHARTLLAALPWSNAREALSS